MSRYYIAFFLACALLLGAPSVKAHHFNNGVGYPGSPHKGCSPLDEYIDYPHGVEWDELWFHEACLMHDHCFQHGWEVGWSMFDCQEMFSVNMGKACHQEKRGKWFFAPIGKGTMIPFNYFKYGACKTGQKVYRTVTDVLGDSSYHVNPYTSADGTTLWCAPRVYDETMLTGESIRGKYCSPELVVDPPNYVENPSEVHQSYQPHGDTLTLSEGQSATFSFRPLNRPENVLEIEASVAPSKIRVHNDNLVIRPETWRDQRAIRFEAIDDRKRDGDRWGTIVIRNRRPEDHGTCDSPENCSRYRHMRSVRIPYHILDDGYVDSTEPPTQQCAAQVHAGDNIGSITRIELGKSSGTTVLYVNTYSVPDRVVVHYDGDIIYDTQCVATTPLHGCTDFGRICCDNGVCAIAITYGGSSSWMDVEVFPNCAGTSDTQWEFSLSCP